MGRELEGLGAQGAPVVKAAATLLLLALLVAAGERSLAPLTMEGPDDRTPADVRATDAVYRYAASYATLPEALNEPLEDF